MALRVSISSGRGHDISDNESPKYVASELGNQVREKFLKTVTSKYQLDSEKLEHDLTDQLSYIYGEALQMSVRSIIGRIHSRTTTYDEKWKKTTTPTSRGNTVFDIARLVERSALGMGWRQAHRQKAQIRSSDRGLTKAPAPPSGSITVTWANLAAATIRQKTKAKVAKPTAFFQATSELMSALRSFSGQLVKTRLFRVQRVGRDAKGRFVGGSNLPAEIKLDELKITLLPLLRRSTLPLFGNKWDDSFHFEKEALHLPEGVLHKLMNTSKKDTSSKNPGGGPKRHLLQPVFTYYTRFEAPKAIRRAILSADIRKRGS